MANPRKFSEKIALHNQKQAEETAAFEKIMREVSDATQKVKKIVINFLLKKCIEEKLGKIRFFFCRKIFPIENYVSVLVNFFFFF